MCRVASTPTSPPTPSHPIPFPRLTQQELQSSRRGRPSHDGQLLLLLLLLLRLCPFPVTSPAQPSSTALGLAAPAPPVGRPFSLRAAPGTHPTAAAFEITPPLCCTSRIAFGGQTGGGSVTAAPGRPRLALLRGTGGGGSEGREEDEGAPRHVSASRAPCQGSLSGQLKTPPPHFFFKAQTAQAVRHQWLYSGLNKVPRKQRPE